MRRSLLSIPLLLAVLFAYSQSAADVLENGMVIRNREKIFLKLTGSGLKYDVGNIPTDFIMLKDSAIFLAVREGVNVYMRPLNPLNFSYKTENKIIIDPVEEQASNTLTSITDLLEGIQAAAALPRPVPCNFSGFEAAIKKIRDSINEDKKEDVAATYKLLESISFNSAKTTSDSIGIAKAKLQAIEDHFTRIDDAIKAFRTTVEALACTTTEPFVAKYILNNIATELENLKEEKYKRVVLLKGALVLVEKAYNAANVESEGLTWLIPVNEVPSGRGNVSLYSVTINESGYNLSDKNEIIEAETKESLQRVLRIGSYRRFVPEVSAGVAYTNLSFPKFGTETDTLTGKQTVVAAGEEQFKRLNFTAMLNVNYFIPNSLFHPFFQIGIGANTDYPTLFTGIGGRLNFRPLRRLAISWGRASSWIRTLDGLKIGDTVSGDAELEKHIKHEFRWPPKQYIGIQLNF